jgi:hypothetical protein
MTQIPDNIAEIEKKLASASSLSKVADISFLGPLNHNDYKGIYSGGISISNRLKKRELTRAEIAGIEKDVPRFMTKAREGGRVRCIDGRILKDLLDAFEGGDRKKTQELLDRPLGFQTPGGVPYMGLAYRIASGQIEKDLSFDNDMEHVAAGLARGDFPYLIGGHIDEHARWPNTGCGAIDQVDATLIKASDPSAIHEIYYWAKQLAYKDLWDEEIFDASIGRIVRLQGIRDKYLLHDKQSNEFTYKRKAIEIVERFSEPGENNMPPLADDHLEAFVVVNKLPGYTFNTDLFYLHNRRVGASGRAVQAFGWDVWSSRLMGNYFFNQDREMMKAYFHTRVILGVAALMVLTDGSPALISIADKD